MAEKELSPIRIPVLLDTRGLENQIKGTNAKIKNGFTGQRVGGAAGGGIGGGGAFVNVGGGGGGIGAFGIAAGAAGFSAMSNVIQTQFMMAERNQTMGMRIKKTKKSTSTPSSYYQFRFGNSGLGGKTMGMGLGGFGGVEETTEFAFVSMNNERAAMFQQTAFGGGGPANEYRPNRSGGSRRALGGKPRLPPDARYMDQVTAFERIGGQVGGRMGGAIASLGALSKSPIAGIGLMTPITLAAQRLKAGYDYFKDYSNNMRSNAQGLAAQYTDPMLQERALAFQRKWQNPTPPTPDKFQRFMANSPGWLQTTLDYISTGWDIINAPESLTPNGYAYGEQRMNEFKIRNFGTPNEQRELVKKQKRAARAAERNAV